MVKVFIKGGVWKNSEDEILKAAVMKYGKQNWARVASLLNRKSAKQCKARWMEWLDPSIKKVEWNRTEEEKLLHLAKLLPSQWKTIGPIVGRTATQCQEHYEQLLDEAAGGSSGSNAREQQYQPGQIDSAPETKPARPDPMDMDEDEMEMLQEARARLANTLGKKAKRKAREKMLAQAKRLAELQKRRELKQAGLLSSAANRKSKKRKKEIDYGVEIPFHKPTPAGFHDTSIEDERALRLQNKRWKSVDYKQVNENQYRTRDREAMQAKKREEARLRLLESSNMQYVVAQVSQQNDAPNITNKKRPALQLPAPTVSDVELSQLSKMQKLQQEQHPGDTAAGVTQALLGDYSDRPLPTPMRTPGPAAKESKHASMLREASQMRRLQQGQTPLLDATSTQDDLQEEEDSKPPAVTLNAPTPMHSSRGLHNKTPLQRDALGLNKDVADGTASVIGSGDAASVYGSSSTFGGSISIRDLAREERRAAKRARKELEAALASLPAPQFEYELALPEMEKEDDDDKEKKQDDVFIADQADLDAARMKNRQAEATKLYEARSTVLKRNDLPRPTNVDHVSFDDDEQQEPMTQILKECKKLMQHDAYAHPIITMTDESSSKKKKKKLKAAPKTTTTPVTLDYIPPNELDKAKQMIQDEYELLVETKLEMVNDDEDALVDENVASTQDGVKNLYWNGSNGYQSIIDLQHLKKECSTIQKATTTLQAKNDKLESKLGLKYGGYKKRCQTILSESIHESFASYETKCIEESIYQQLQQQEQVASRKRIDSLNSELNDLEKQNSTLQNQYGTLLLEKKRIMMIAKRGKKPKNEHNQET